MIKKIVRRVSSAQINSFISNPVLARVYANRGVEDAESVSYSMKNLYSPEALKGVDAAVDILFDALSSEKSICIVGDFDADGATSTALSVRALLAFGFHNVNYVVPNRFEYGYGLTPEIVDLANTFKPDVILTVDNGISSVEGVAAAKKLGMSVIITDHHLPGKHLPNADAIVNPNQPDCKFPCKNLAGVGVVFYLLSALRAFLRKRDWFAEHDRDEPNMASYLDLVALGTIADVVPLDGNNRILVAQGLQRIRAGHCCAGIRALLTIANKNIHTVVSSDLAFAVGPRLNAAGRLDDMSLGIQCLLSDSIYEAEKIARELNDLNLARREIELQMQQEAMALLDKLDNEFQPQKSFGIGVYRDEWHEGVIGILASRIKEKFHRPTIVFARTRDGEYKGSGRSIEGVHLRDVLDEVATSSPGILNKFGGHAMAAGLSISGPRLEEFIELFDACIARHLNHTFPQAEIFSDGQLSGGELNVETALALRNAGPWGQAFPEPVFDGEFRVLQQRMLKDKHLKLLLSAEEYSGEAIDGIAFNVDTVIWPNEDVKRVHLVYRLEVNEYRGNVNPQILIEQIEAVV